MNPISLRGLGELAAFVPYLLGFQVRRSLVVAGLLQDGSVGPVGRVDLPPPAHRELVAEALARPMATNGLRVFHLLAYTDTDTDTDTDTAASADRSDTDNGAETGPGCGRHPTQAPGADARRALAAARRALVRATGGRVLHEVLVRDDQWLVLRCRGRCRCRTGVWEPLPEPSTIAAVAEQVLREARPLGNRAELERSLALRHPLVASVVLALLTSPSPAVAEIPAAVPVAAAWGAVLDDADGASPVASLAPQLLATAMVSVQHVPTRDELLAWLAPQVLGTIDARPAIAVALATAMGAPHWRAAGLHDLDPCVSPEQPSPRGQSTPGPDEEDVDLTRAISVRRVSARLAELLSCTPAPYVDAVATVLGYWCWVQGSGAMALVAVQRALLANPGYAMARLLDEAMAQGVRPGTARPSPRERAC